MRHSLAKRLRFNHTAKSGQGAVGKRWQQERENRKVSMHRWTRNRLMEGHEGGARQG